MYKIRAATVAALLLELTACSSNLRQTPGEPTASSSSAHKAAGSRYSLLQDQGPEVDIDVGLIPDAIPKAEPRTIAGNMSPYSVLGKTYQVQFDTRGFSQTGYASWYGKKFHGERTSNGEIYNMFAMTAAHKTLPIPCYVRVTNLDNNRAVTLRVNDRGPFHDDRIIDLTYTAAKKLGFHAQGTARVRVDVVNAGDSQSVPIATFRPIANALAPLPVKAAAPSQAPATSTVGNSTSGNSVSQTGVQITPRPSINAATKPPVVANLVSTAKNSNLTSPTYLQVGSFSTEASAQKLQQSLKGTTHYPIILMPVEGKSLVRVLIGPFVVISDIQALKQQLIEKKLSVPYVVQGLKKN